MAHFLWFYMRLFNFARLILSFSNDTDDIYPFRAPILTKCILFNSIFASCLLLIYSARYFCLVMKICKKDDDIVNKEGVVILDQSEEAKKE